MDARDIDSPESEAGILATLIHHPDFVFYSENLCPNHFANKENRCFYAAINELAHRNIKNIDAFNIMEILSATEATRRLSAGITLDRVQELVEMSDILARGTLEEYKVLVENVLDAAFRRDTYRALQKCLDLCGNRDEKNLEKRIYDEVDAVMTEFSSADDIPVFGDVVESIWSDVEQHQDGCSTSIPLKFPTLNEYVTLEQGELVIVGATAKGGKSFFMLNEAVDIMKQGKSVFYIDSELSSRLFLCRLVSHLTGIQFKRIKGGLYDENERKQIQEAIRWIKQQRFVHLYMPVFDQQTVYTAVKKVAHKFGTLDVLIVDYFKGNVDGTAWDAYSNLGKFVDLVKNEICGDMNIAGLGAAQLAFGSTRLADSAKIARNASTILLLMDKTVEEVEADGAECGNKKIVCQLNRNGMQHAAGEYIDLFFDGNVGLMTEAKQHIPEQPY